MSDKKKTPIVSYTFRYAIADYPALNSPCTRFSQTGEYKCTLTYQKDSKEAEEAMAFLDKQLQIGIEYLEAENDYKITETNPSYLLNDDGKVSIRLKNKSFVTKKGEIILNSPAFFNYNAQPLKTIPTIRSGSLLNVTADIVPYSMRDTDRKTGESFNVAGLSLRMKAIQILKLSDGYQRSAKDYGFSTEEGFATTEEMDADVDF